MSDLLNNPQLLEALAKLAGATLWPIVALVLALLFKREISSVARRIKKGKLLGSEFELTEELDKFAIAAEKAQSEIYVPPPPTAAEGAAASPVQATEGDVEAIIKLASENPEFGLILLARKIEEEMKRLLAMGGHLRGRRSLSIRDMAEYLGRNAAVSENLRKSLEIFWDVRNKIVHGHGDVSREDLIRTIDIGLTVLSAIRTIPHEKNVVAHPGAEMFADPEGKHPLEGVKALILETTTPGGARKLIRVFPTTRTDYRPGMTVTWEWNTNLTWGRCYYRDPWTKEIKEAWRSSAEFVGRDIEAI
jgi:hypothetical protein